MAVQGIATIADLNIPGIRQAYKQKEKTDFLSNFQGKIKERMFSAGPKLSYQDNQLAFTPGVAPLTKEGLWNLYKMETESEGIKPDLNYYTQYIEPMLDSQDVSSIPNQMQSLSALGISEKEIKGFAQKNPEFKDYMMSEAMADPQKAVMYTPYIGEDAGMFDFLSKPGGLIGPAIGLGAGSVALKKLYKSELLKKYPKIGKGLPLAALLAAQPLARKLGATDAQAETIGRTAGAGVGSYYGAKGVANLATNRLASGLATGSPAELKARLKKLSNKNIKGLSKKAIQAEIGKQVTKQGLRETTKKVGASASKKALLKFTAKAGAKQAMGSALPFWGNLAMAALTVPDMIELGRAMFSGEE